ncbi:MAG: type VI secretion system contractile sheath small subunit [Deltaproteobacteria bacterium]|nr:type VI secretion system contractile sheath small subunit [Deltaproteobacteria bacterium]MBK7068355.1 type VI secretion system contractile sheath small subunit [Deltaproteobacteria bacterium]MBK8697686.1 type VI secretion system contractile sheath small subunit [Deltaproteobacteria bacterium]MBP6830110.1 type VI secretion system contractile sheath small subunit [Deltaproteobacteria bacterium]
MSREGSVAPKERVNIVYKPATGNAQEEVELPLKIMMVGDYTLRPDDQPVENRKPINVDKDNFNQVLGEQKLELNLGVSDKLSNEPGAEMAVNLKFKKLSDFTPEGVANQVPEMRKLLELRSALNALKGPLGNVPAFRKKIQGLLGDEEGRAKLMQELGLGDKGGT